MGINISFVASKPQAEESIINLGSGLKVFNLLRPLARWAWGRFAQQPRWRALVSWESYYREYLNAEVGHALIQHTGPYVGDAARQIELINGMAAGRGPAIVWAPPGCGKSRFAIELARRIAKARRRWQVLFVQHDESVVREELHHLTQVTPVVLIVDDAHECPELVKFLAAASARAAAASPLHLVCLTRSTGRAQVSRAINSVIPPGLVQEMDLGRPAAQLVRTLIDQLLPKSSPHHRDTIERFVRQSYFGAVLVCTILKRQGKLPQTFARQDLRDRVCREPLREAADGVCPIETALRALAVYVALAPVAKASAEVRELAAQLSALAPERVEVLLERVLAAGLVQEYGHARVRPVPDLLGDLILEEACLDGQGRPTPFSTKLLERVFEFDAVTAVSNCADIGQLFGSAQDVDIVSALILARARAVPAENTSDILKLLQTCEPLAARRPATVLEVAGILEGRAILRRAPPADELFGIDSIEMATCALLMRAGEVDPTAIPVALRLARDLYRAARGGDARNQQHVREQLEAYCKFEMGRSVAHAQAVVNTLSAWVSESDAQAAALAGYLSARFLPLEVQGQREEGHSVTLPRGTLNPVVEVWAVRDVAVDTLVRGLSHGEIAVQCASVRALEQYAETQLAPDQVPIEAWRAQLAREIETLSSAIRQRLTTTEHLPLCAIAEQVGWHWWAQELDLLHRAGMAILESIRDTDSYRLWKLLHAQRLPVWTVVPQVSTGDIETRRQHVQALAMIREEDAAEQARRLFDEIDLRHANSGAWRELWRSVCDQSPLLPLHNQAGAVVGAFARRHPETAWSWVTEAEADGPLFRLLPFLLVELGKQDRARRSLLAREVRAGTRLEEAWLRALWFAQEPDEAERALLARSLGSTDSDTVQHAASALLNASRADRVEAYRAVFAAIAQQPTQSALWQLVIERFVHWADGVLPPRPAEPDEAIVGVASDLLRLLQTHSSHVRWGFQPHTRQLAKALAILMVVHPQRLQDWMRVAWGPGKGPRGGWDDESPLSVSRLSEIMRLIRGLPAAARWIEVFLEWMKRDTQLGAIGALGLAELCSLDDPRVGELVQVIGAHPTEASVKAFTEFIQHQKSESGFAEKALALLEVWTRFPDSYARIENAVIYALAHGVGGRALGQVSPAHERALQAIDACRAQGASSGLLLASLERAEREVREAMGNQVARDEEFE